MLSYTVCHKNTINKKKKKTCILPIPRLDFNYIMVQVAQTSVKYIMVQIVQTNFKHMYL